MEPRADVAPRHSAEAPNTGASRRTGVLLILLSGTAFGAMPLFARAAYADGVTPSAALFVRFALAALCMLALMAIRRTAFPRGRDLKILILLGGIIYVGQSLTYYMALGHTSASIAALVVYVYPALVTAFAALFLKEPLTRLKLTAIGLSLIGCALTVGPLRGANLFGISLSLASAVMYATYVLIGTRLAGRSGAVATTTVILSSTAVSYGALLAVSGPRWPQTGDGWAALVGLALVSTVVAVLAFLAGVRRVGAVAGSTISTVEPVIAVILAMVFLGESLNAIQLAGGALIVVAVLLIARPQGRLET